jgi:hypothetical protein
MGRHPGLRLASARPAPLLSAPGGRAAPSSACLEDRGSVRPCLRPLGMGRHCRGRTLAQQTLAVQGEDGNGNCRWLPAHWLAHLPDTWGHTWAHWLEPVVCLCLWLQEPCLVTQTSAGAAPSRRTYGLDVESLSTLGELNPRAAGFLMGPSAWD